MADVSVAGQAVGGVGLWWLMMVKLLVGCVSAVSQVSPQGRLRAVDGVGGMHHPTHTPTDTYTHPNTVLAPISLPHLESR